MKTKPFDIPPGWERISGNQLMQPGDKIWTKYGWRDAGDVEKGNRADFYQCVIRKKNTQ